MVFIIFVFSKFFSSVHLNIFLSMSKNVWLRFKRSRSWILDQSINDHSTHSGLEVKVLKLLLTRSSQDKSAFIRGSENILFEILDSEPLKHDLSSWKGLIESYFNFIQKPLDVPKWEEVRLIGGFRLMCLCVKGYVRTRVK